MGRHGPSPHGKVCSAVVDPGARIFYVSGFVFGKKIAFVFFFQWGPGATRALHRPADPLGLKRTLVGATVRVS